MLISIIISLITEPPKQQNRTHQFEVIGHLEFVLLRGKVGLDFRIRVVDDRQEHVEQDEEDEEDVENKIGGAEDAVCLLQRLEIEVAKDDAEQRETINRQHVNINVHMNTND